MGGTPRQEAKRAPSSAERAGVCSWRGVSGVGVGLGAGGHLQPLPTPPIPLHQWIAAPRNSAVLLVPLCITCGWVL